MSDLPSHWDCKIYLTCVWRGPLSYIILKKENRWVVRRLFSKASWEKNISLSCHRLTRIPKKSICWHVSTSWAFVCWHFNEKTVYKDSFADSPFWIQTDCKKEAEDLYTQDWSCNILTSHWVTARSQQRWKTTKRIFVLVFFVKLENVLYDVDAFTSTSSPSSSSSSSSSSTTTLWMLVQPVKGTWKGGQGRKKEKGREIEPVIISFMTLFCSLSARLR